MSKNSVRAKIETMKPGEKMVFIRDDIESFMRVLESSMCRQRISPVIYRRAQVIIKDELFLGIMVEKKGNVNAKEE